MRSKGSEEVVRRIDTRYREKVRLGSASLGATLHAGLMRLDGGILCARKALEPHFLRSMPQLLDSELVRHLHEF